MHWMISTLGRMRTWTLILGHQLFWMAWVKFLVCISIHMHTLTLQIHQLLPAQSYPAQADDIPLYNDADLYLGPEDDIPGMYLNSNAHILTLKIHDLIPDQSCPAGADDLPLFNDPDLYLGPQDDLIESDDPPAVPDSPLTGE